MLMELLTPKNIKSYFAAKDYKFFDTPNKRLNLNIIGVRRDNQGSNTFDDFLLVMYREEEIKELVALAGGVHETSVKTGLRIQTIYRLMNGQNRPSFETNMKLEALENELNKIKVS